MIWSVMAKAIIMDRRGRFLLLFHPKWNQLFFTGGRILNPRTLKPLKLRTSSAAEVVRFLEGLTSRPASESGIAAIRRRCCQELRDEYRLVPYLTEEDFVHEYSYPALVRHEIHPSGELRNYVYRMTRVSLPAEQLARLERAAAASKQKASFCSMEDITSGTDRRGVPISPNVLEVLRELRLVPELPVEPRDGFEHTSDDLAATA